MPKQARRLTDKEIDIFNQGRLDPNITLDYLFWRSGVNKGFQLDSNFAEKGKWQKKVCIAQQTFIIIIGGIGTGKSICVGMSAIYHGVQTPGFKFLNIAKESWQSQLMYELLLENAEGTVMEEFIVNSPKRPYPQIVIEYYVGDRKVRSTLEFMSIGEKGDATNVFSWRGDWINVEEAGRIDNLQPIVSNLSTRLTGNTAEGRPFMGRLSLITNPWDNDELWQLYDMAQNDKEDGLALEVLTEDNNNVTEKQLENALKLIPERERDRFITGRRPEGRGTYFPKAIVEPCESSVLSEQLLEKVNKGEKGYVLEKLPRIGYWHYAFAPQEGRVYFQIGDPGTGEAPARNAPVWMIFDVTEAPLFTPIVSLWWGMGFGSISPFITKGLDLLSTYRPILAGMDSTATQKNMAEIVNMEYVNGKGYSVNKFTGFDFSGTRKYTYLVCAKLAIEGQHIVYPDIAKGISSQLQNYDPTKDFQSKSKLPQDLVSTISMGAFAIRSYFGFPTKEDKPDDTPNSSTIEFNRRLARNSHPLQRDLRRFSQRNTRD